MAVTYKHSYNVGDLLTLLPGIKNVYKVSGEKAIIYQNLNLPAYYGHADSHPIKSEDGTNVCMNRYMFDMVKPLIEYQEYVQEFKVWKGEAVTFNIDLTRKDSQMPLPGGDIYYWPNLIFPYLKPDFSEPWIDFNYDDRNRYDWSKYILINRTERYKNPYIHYFFLKEHQGKIKFVGTEKEHELFNKEFDLSVSRLVVSDFYHLALYIANCRFFIGNQSMAYHASEGTFARRILEVCTAFPNTFPHSKDGYCFINQESLEYYFKKLLKETE